jgi:hypothetical protein
MRFRAHPAGQSCILCVCTIFLTIPAPPAGHDFESFDDAWEVPLLEEGARSLGRRAMLGRYDPLPPQAKGMKPGGGNGNNPGKGH